MFGALCMAVAAICVGLFAVFLISPASYTALYGVTGDPGLIFVGRRAAPLFLGLAVFFWVLRTAGPGPLQDATALAAALIFGGIALTGLWAWWGGTGGTAILVAAGLEAVIALAFMLARQG
ncbi:hypothetical protein SAMN04488003_12313 [Loktanella fryxellensis]|uniref:DUF4345 domain-containing protein n=1 Tax=Loktanella fryxellensis TaxID=245187 RepID=A0A1H8I0F4_9RHOB|nr:hypothetical protein [Loktanella fryxellensis]SEN61724.1 hypothetical protein SAMN04488003_12313 [Loktanella fryxellensis]